jgi:hypothetical protein
MCLNKNIYSVFQARSGYSSLKYSLGTLDQLQFQVKLIMDKNSLKGFPLPNCAHNSQCDPICNTVDECPSTLLDAAVSINILHPDF